MICCHSVFPFVAVATAISAQHGSTGGHACRSILNVTHVTEMTSQFKSDLHRHINLDACHLMYNTTPQAQSVRLG